MSATVAAQATPLPRGVIEAIVGLAQLSHIRSFSLPFHDAELWVGLISAQVKRAAELNLEPFRAMALISTGGPISGVHEGNVRLDLQMGGFVSMHGGDEVHPADVFAWPGGAGLDPTAAQAAENLSHAVFHTWYRERSSFCKCFLTTAQDIGEVAQTTRNEIGEWVQYQSVDPNYIDALRITLPWNNREIAPRNSSSIVDLDW